MTFLETAQLFDQIEKTSGRTDMTTMLVNMYPKLDFEEAQIFTYMLDGRVAPYFIDAEFNYSEKSMLTAINDFVKAHDLNFNSDESRKASGDIGLTISAFYTELEKKGSVERLEGFQLKEVYEVLWKIVKCEGNGSVAKKNDMFLNSLKRMSALESKFFARIVVGKLRLGASVKSILDALSILASGSKELRELLDFSYGFTSDSGYLAALVINNLPGGVENVRENLNKIKPVPGVPIYPRLVERVESFEDGFNRMMEQSKGEPYVLQPKYDGMRCQIHIGVDYNDKDLESRVWSDYLKSEVEAESNFDMFAVMSLPEDNLSENVADLNLDSKNGLNNVPDSGINNKKDKIIKLFSRNLEDLTDMFPEIVEAAKALNCESAILDSEIVGIDYENNTFIPFQDTMKRRRKYDVGNKVEDIPVKCFVFDLVEKNGSIVSTSDFTTRITDVFEIINDGDKFKTLLAEKKGNISQLYEFILEESAKSFLDRRSLINIAPTNLITNISDQRELFDKYVDMGFEGVVIKNISAQYLPGVRNYEWIKLKKSMDQGNVDTIDLVILGYYFGSGKQVEFGMGALLAGVFNKKSGLFDPVTKIGTGITQEQWREIKVQLDEITLREEELVEISGQKFCKQVSVGNYETPDKWVYPKIVVQVDADEISRSQSYEAGKEELGFGLALRFPRLIDFNRDKLAEDSTSVGELIEMYKIRKSIEL
jgi:ATP-dependent DNA ligase